MSRNVRFWLGLLVLLVIAPVSLSLLQASGTHTEVRGCMDIVAFGGGGSKPLFPDVIPWFVAGGIALVGVALLANALVPDPVR